MMDAPSESTETANRHRRRHSTWSDPGTVATLWIVTTVVHVIDQVRFPEFGDDSPYTSSVLFLSSAPVLGALVAASIGRGKHRVLALAGELLIVQLVAGVAWLAAEIATSGTGGALGWIRLGIAALSIAVSIWVIGRGLRGARASPARRGIATAAAAGVILAWQSASMLYDPLLEIASSYASPTEADQVPAEIDEERLWSQQPALVAEALKSLAPPGASGQDTYVVAIGASGSQRIFGREARLARTVLANAFGATRRSLILANDEPSLYRAPLANNTNLEALFAGIGKAIDPSRDLVVIYLTSHGGRDAKLTTDLPDFEAMDGIGAKRLADVLARNGIKRRVIIVSACYSGSWIKPLATPDTIVVTAARADRSSFGCSDDRELTYFGEALLKGPLSSGASLEQGFAAAHRTVARWERKPPHSEPQAYVGSNMAGVWKARP